MLAPSTNNTSTWCWWGLPAAPDRCRLLAAGEDWWVVICRPASGNWLGCAPDSLPTDGTTGLVGSNITPSQLGS
jgi:hypothetical protein